MTSKLRILFPVLFIAAVLIINGIFTAYAENIPGDTAVSSDEYILGDVNGDGIVSVSDVTCIQRSIADLPVNGVFSEPSADADGNNVIEITDADIIQRWVACMDTPYPIGTRFEMPTEPATEPTTETPTEQPTDSQGWGLIIFQP